MPNLMTHEQLLQLQDAFQNGYSVPYNKEDLAYTALELKRRLLVTADWIVKADHLPSGINSRFKFECMDLIAEYEAEDECVCGRYQALKAAEHA